MRVCFIYNPESGSGKITSYLAYIEEEFLKYNHEITLYATKREKDAYLYAKLSSEYDMVLVAGGDGTLNEVVNGVMTLDNKPTIAYIPTGTVNDVGHLIGMKKNVKKTLRLILKKPIVKEMDICRINDKYFVYVAAAGRFTKSSYDISRNSKKRFGKVAYFFRGSQEIFKDYNMPIKVTSATEVFEETSSLILILNGRRVGGIRLYNLKTKLDDGTMSFKSFQREPWMFFRVMLFFITGGLYGTKKHKTYKSTYFKVETKDDVSWNIDGEYMGTGSIEVSVVNKALKFIVNKKKVKKNFKKE